MAITSVTQSTESQQALAASTPRSANRPGSRSGFVISNESGATMYVGFGSQPTTQLHSLAMVDGSVYESPKWMAGVAVHVIWGGSGSGKAFITAL